MRFHTVIIGAGQAGLTAGYMLKGKVRPLVILEAGNEIGNSWKGRYDSLILFTPAKYNSLPKFYFPLSDDQHPSKQDMATYLKHFVGFNNLPVHFNQQVQLLKRYNGDFWIESDVNSYLAKNVIVATGAHQQPYIPPLTMHPAKNLFQAHSSQYKNPSQVPKGNVLVVGGGNSASEIVLDLINTHQVYISPHKKLRFKGQYILGKNWFWWERKTGIAYVSSRSLLGRHLKKRGEPIYGKQLLHEIKKGKVKVLPPLERVEGQDAIFKTGGQLKIMAVIWATGFANDFSWIDIPELFDVHGNPKHRKGVSNVPGIYFLGMDWQRSRSSSLIAGTERDARYIIKRMFKRDV